MGGGVRVIGNKCIGCKDGSGYILGKGYFLGWKSSVIAGLAGYDTVCTLDTKRKGKLGPRGGKNVIMAGVGCGQSGVYPGWDVAGLC